MNFNIKFFGNVKKVWENNREVSHWENSEIILARAYDTPIPGYHTWNTISLRLWRSMPRAEFDFTSFN